MSVEFLCPARGEIFDEFQQPVGFCVFRTVPWNTGKDGLCVAAEHGEFEQEGGVEHNVGIFLVGEYPFVLAGTYTGPA